MVRYEHNGGATVLAEKWQGKPLNAPNDIVVHPDGGIWFTDPGYGSMVNYEGHKGELRIKRPLPNRSQGGKMDLVSDEVNKPNGICFSPDYKKLYVADTGGTDPKPIHVWDVSDNTKLGNGRKFCSMEMNREDGWRRRHSRGCRWQYRGWGRLGGEGYDGVHIFAPDGQRIG